MSPTPRRQPPVECPDCGTPNDTAGGRSKCRNCQYPLPKSEAAPFEFPATGQIVRTVTIDGEPWFVANDVCAVLDLHSGRALARLDEDEKGVRSTQTPGGMQDLAHVNEPGLYVLVLGSRKPEAKAFKRWITHEVLPAIRRTGSYSAVPAHDVPRTLPDALRAYATEVEAHEQTQAALAEAAPKADAWDALAEAKGDYSLREAAQILSRDPLISTGQNRLAAYLREIGWVDTSKQPYQSQIDNGRLHRRSRPYFDQSAGESKTTTQIRITVKGLKDLRYRMAGQRQLVVIEGGA